MSKEIFASCSREIEEMLGECQSCQLVKNAPGATWKRVHLDFAGPAEGTMFLLSVDAHTQSGLKSMQCHPQPSKRQVGIVMLYSLELLWFIVTVLYYAA